MIIEKIQTDGPVKVVDQDQVEYHTAEGWKVIGMVIVQTTETKKRKVPKASPDHFSKVDEVDEFYPATQLRFVLQADPESIVATATSALNEALRRVERAEREEDEATRKLNVSQERVATLEARLKESEDRADRWEKELETAEARSRAMERDIAKVRKHVGERMMNEALASDG